jgi:hypothetical protein
MIKLGLLCAIIAICSASYSESLGEKLGKLTVASYCRKAEV